MEFHERYGPWAVVAGASEGVGAEAARMLGERGVNVVLVSRRQALLDEVATTVATETRQIALDLSRPDAAATLAEATADLEVGLLIYNAGAKNPKPLWGHSLEEWQGVITRNCTTVLGATYHYGRGMVERGHGGIVIVSSQAAWGGMANLAVYGGTKAFDLVFAEALWAELRPAGVDVLTMVLGATDTPAFLRLIEGRDRTDLPLDSSIDVARTMLDSLGDGPTYPPGPARDATVPRRELVERRSAAATGLAD